MNYTEALQAVDRFRDRARSLREAASQQMESAIDTMAILGGGAISGYIVAAYGDKELFGIKYNIILGVGLSAIGLFELAGRESHAVGALGEGMLAHAVGEMVRTKVAAKSKTAGVGELAGGGEVRQLPVGMSESALVRAIREHQAIAAA